MINHRLRVILLAIFTFLLLVAAIFVEVLGVEAERVAGMIEGAFVTAAAGLWDALKADKKIVEVSDREEKQAVEVLRDSRRSSVHPPAKKEAE